MIVLRLLLVIAIATTATATACGGGGPTAQEAARMLLDQGGECYAVAAGRSAPHKFNSTAADIASVAQPDVCMAWPASLSISCADYYAMYSKPFSGRCL